MTQWETLNCEIYDTETRRKAAVDGWEPFAVADGRVWFRRHRLADNSVEYPADVQNAAQNFYEMIDRLKAKK